MDHHTFKMSAIRGNDQVVVCPYNPSHQILKSRLQTHLVKCARQHKEKEMATCTFNSTHRVPRPELPGHLRECPDRKSLEAHKFTLSNEVGAVAGATVPPPSADALPACEENWDDDVSDVTYDPTAHVSQMKVLRTLTGATKSERRRFRLEERRRVTQLEAAAKVNMATTPRAPGQVDAMGRVNQGGGTDGFGRGILRRPRTVPDSITQSLYSGRLGMGRGAAPPKA